MELPFVDIDGNRHARAAWDMHHTIPRSRAHSTNERQFINLDGLALPLFRVWHNLGSTAIHNNVELAPMPSPRLQSCIRVALYETDGMNPYDRFLDVLDVVTGIGDVSHNPGLAKDARRLGQNLTKQAYYILNGQVRDLSELSNEA